MDLTQRRDKIVSLLQKHEELSAANLSQRLKVSVQTIRSDLRDLDEAALVHRRNGRARLRPQGENIGYQPRSGLAQGEKQKIAVQVAKLIPDGARIALGTGTTIEQCAGLLAEKSDLFVATNSIHAGLALQQAKDLQIQLSGGTVRLRDLDMIGGQNGAFFARHPVEFAILSCGGISPDGDVLDFNTHETQARLAVVEAAQQSILVIDSSKFNQTLTVAQGRIWDYDVVVTGAKLSADLHRRCDAAGCQIINC